MHTSHSFLFIEEVEHDCPEDDEVGVKFHGAHNIIFLGYVEVIFIYHKVCVRNEDQRHENQQ